MSEYAPASILTITTPDVIGHSQTTIANLCLYLVPFLPEVTPNTFIFAAVPFYSSKLSLGQHTSFYNDILYSFLLTLALSIIR